MTTAPVTAATRGPIPTLNPGPVDLYGPNGRAVGTLIDALGRIPLDSWEAIGTLADRQWSADETAVMDGSGVAWRATENPAAVGWWAAALATEDIARARGQVHLDTQPPAVRDGLRPFLARALHAASRAGYAVAAGDAYTPAQRAVLVRPLAGLNLSTLSATVTA